MKKASCNDFLPTRQIELQRQIFEASHLIENERLSILEALWVHRYGLETLPRNSISSEFSPKDQLNVPESMPIETIQGENSITNGQTVNSNSEQRSSEKSVRLVEEQSHEGQESLEEENACITNPQIGVSSSKSLASPPPPPPSLSHLRRWLPGRDEIPKAS